ncbi:MAG: hypothetical protein V1819_00005 [bacterium]
MTKQSFIFLFIFVGLITALSSIQAKIFNQETSPIKNPSDVPDALAQYQIQGEAKGILDKITGEWKKINDWGTGFWAKSFKTSFLGKYANQLKENIKQGWEEEKQEYRQDFFKALGALWEKIKGKLFHR